jgi:hypothetical protein
MIAGGGLNSAIPNLSAPYSPFNAMDEFKYEYRCIGADLRNANGGQSTGPLEIDRPWDSHTDDHLVLMDHLGIDKFVVLGFCIPPWSWAKYPPTSPSKAVAKPTASTPKAKRLQEIWVAETKKDALAAFDPQADRSGAGRFI